MEQVLVYADYPADPDPHYSFCVVNVEFFGCHDPAALRELDAVRALQSRIWDLPRLIPINTDPDEGWIELFELAISRTKTGLKIENLDPTCSRQLFWTPSDRSSVRKVLASWLHFNANLSAHQRTEIAKHPERILPLLFIPRARKGDFKPVRILEQEGDHVIIALDPAADMLALKPVQGSAADMMIDMTGVL
jgi:hypothetical protein